VVFGESPVKVDVKVPTPEPDVIKLFETVGAELLL
jgi:hypothetical protein